MSDGADCSECNGMALPPELASPESQMATACILMLASLKKAETDNAKLRKLAVGIGNLLFSLDVDYCAACPRDGISHPCPMYTVEGGECLYKTDLRELGIEVPYAGDA